jgi:hypothetical protein
VKKVTTVLLLYAILVIASSVFWVWSAVSKSRLTAGGNSGNVRQAVAADKAKQVAEMATEQATELTGGVTEGVKADGQANDNVKSTGL